jgi:hypothetical protein
VRLLRREDAENDTTAAPNAARKTSPWPVPASNAGLRSRTERLAAIAGGVALGATYSFNTDVPFTGLRFVVADVEVA